MNCPRFILLMLVAFQLIASGEGSMRMPQQIAQALIEDKAGAKLPLDVELTDHNGRQVKLGDYFSPTDKRPIIMAIGYYGCPMLCGLVFGGLTKALMGVSFKPGKDYRLISVSIDETEGVELASAKRDIYLRSLGASSDVDWWSFHVGKSEEAKRLTDALGFNFHKDQRTKEIAHSAGFFVVSPTGILSKTFFGIEFNPSDLKFALSEAADGKIGSFVDQLILSCFHYDPDSHRYGVYIFGVMRLSGLLTVLILGVVLLMYFRGERKRIKSVVS